MPGYDSIMTAAFIAAGFVAVSGHIPTLRSVAAGRASVNRVTYATWVVTSGISFLYGYSVVGNAAMASVSGANAVLSVAILAASAGAGGLALRAVADTASRLRSMSRFGGLTTLARMGRGILTRAASALSVLRG